jgi:hypothetical protein
MACSLFDGSFGKEVVISFEFQLRLLVRRVVLPKDRGVVELMFA